MSFAAALAYYAFLAIPSALLIAVGILGLVANPNDVGTLVDRLGESYWDTRGETTVALVEG